MPFKSCVFDAALGSAAGARGVGCEDGASGGELGGGFCRYSVDRYWTIPHFEKMLYDNGPLLRLYADLWLVERQPLHARTAAATAAWVMREP